MINFAMFSEEHHKLTTAALHTALAHADVFPVLQPVDAGAVKPSAAETAVTTDFCRYCLQNQGVEIASIPYLIAVFDAALCLWSTMIEDISADDMSRIYGLDIGPNDLEKLETFSQYLSSVS